MACYFTEQKFKPLAPYFADLTKRDLDAFDEDDFLDIVEPKHRGLMKIWLKNRNPAPFTPYYGRLLLSEKVVSKNYAGTRPELVPLDKVFAFLENAVAVTVLDLSQCGLRDDEEDIEALAAKLPSLELLVLRGNRLDTFTPSLEKRAQSCFVDICFNPIASSEWKWYFEKYDCHVQKFIWIPYSLLCNSRQTWVDMVGNPDRVPVIEALHLNFYDRFPEWK